MEVLTRDALREKPDEACRRLARFTGKLKVHAAMENSALYPRLLESDDPRVRERAERLFREVGTLYDSFSEYSEQWCVPERVRDAPEAFASETLVMLQRLGRRMARENDELYPLVDASDTL